MKMKVAFVQVSQEEMNEILKDSGVTPEEWKAMQDAEEEDTRGRE